MKQLLSKAFQLSEEQQILLSSDGQSLNSEKTLSQYSQELYLFPKDLMRREELLFEFSVTCIAEKLPNPVETEVRELSETQRKLGKLALQAITKTSSFKAIEARSQQLKYHCFMLIQAAQVVTSNHVKFINSQKHAFEDFWIRFQEHEKFTSAELLEFDLHLEMLKSVPLHAALVSADRKLLGDLLDGTQLAIWKEKFMTEQSRLKVKVVEVENEVKKLEVKQVESSVPETGEVVDISAGVSLAQEVINTYLEYRQLLEKYMPERNATAGRRLFEEQWTERRRVLKSFIPRIQVEEEKIRDSFEAQKLKCFAVSRYFLNIMKGSLSSISKIRDGVKSQVSMLNSLLKRSEQRMQFLLAPKLLPMAYEATLCEVSRRHKFIKKADELRKELLDLIDQETSLRVEFLNQYRNVLPNNFIPQLGEAPDRKYLIPKGDTDRNLPSVEVTCVLPPGYYLCEEQKDFQQVAAALETARKELELARIEEGNCKQTLERMRKEEEASQSELKRLKAIVAQQETQLKLQTEQLQKLAPLKVKCEDYETTFTNLKQTHENSLTKLSTAMSQVADLQKELNTVHQKCDSLSVQLVEKDKELTGIRSRLEESLESSASLLESLRLPSQPEAGLAILKDKVNQLRSDNYKLRKKLQGTIYFTGFPEGALVLFFPHTDGGFVAFHYNCPFHFLDLSSLPDRLAQDLR